MVFILNTYSIFAQAMQLLNIIDANIFLFKKLKFFKFRKID